MTSRHQNHNEPQQQQHSGQRPFADRNSRRIFWTRSLVGCVDDAD
ncbi:hypothetical protein L914_20852 [Phytophthora nicotianae]|nr:hypothetical protein L914_20852 [Phytophthora nicotianae]